MVAEELINHMIPPLKVTDDAHKAVVWMEELRCNELPVVENRKFLGLISEEMILESNDIERPISDFDLIAEESLVISNTHFYNIIKTALDNKVQMVAVHDEEGNYTGIITVQDIITAFAQSAAVQLPGGIIVLSMSQRDYSLAEISRLVEENNAKVINSNVKIDPLDADKIKVTLKINDTDLTRIIATLERFEYKIIARFQDMDVTNMDKEKIDMLFKYLEI